MVEAIVLAGSLNDRGLREISKEPYEALIPLAGKPMVEYVLDALQESPSISRIIVVGPASLAKLQIPKLTTVVESTISVMDNLRLGLEQVSGEKYVLLATSDIPLLTAAAVEDFIARSRDQEGDLFYSIVDKKTNENYFSGIQRTYVKLKDGTFTGGNLFYFHPRIARSCWSFAEEMVNLRKEPLKMCARLGFFFILRLLAGKLTIADLERRVEKLLAIKAKAVISPYPGVGIDIDKPADYQYVLPFLKRKEA
ncbi:MAG TPA: NTP transferase domain-containing protein [Firmicutes bacterium]|jgi:molybdopterin-guanine dinucleotide biosynthesis protein A|nr:NTP transferase domain-containing protein [Bacillota bacterium]